MGSIINTYLIGSLEELIELMYIKCIEYSQFYANIDNYFQYTNFLERDRQTVQLKHLCNT